MTPSQPTGQLKGLITYRGPCASFGKPDLFCFPTLFSQTIPYFIIKSPLTLVQIPLSPNATSIHTEAHLPGAVHSDPIAYISTQGCHFRRHKLVRLGVKDQLEHRQPVGTLRLWVPRWKSVLQESSHQTKEALCQPRITQSFQRLL